MGRVQRWDVRGGAEVGRERGCRGEGEEEQRWGVRRVHVVFSGAAYRSSRKQMRCCCQLFNLLRTSPSKCPVPCMDMAYNRLYGN